ncbi:MAG TPA: CoA-binding protein [Chitinophagaceae bacterium]|nr:CoA-binding protein [Chitinophagaceae bacterium]MCC6635857.1 CoA-binding protein [Chitinophagaceae bacterium]HNE93155.1 CoA-binding protein [Chitinophagaceae bacterium]HNF29566.1 CoA-binding protein [Chitinophagaceae bacterium]HNJ58595.1 CoA-binding protein [Chitinophagaceae bacterium]
MKKKTLVLGASDNTERYSNMAVKKLVAHGHTVVAVGNKDTFIDTIPVYKEKIIEDGIDTVTLYLSPKNQIPFYSYIISLKPKRIIFNPGTENEDLVTLAKQNNIQTIEACTLVMLNTGQY